MQRIAFPPDVCADPGARYYRTLDSAFPCGAAEAVAIHRPARRTRYRRWVLLALLVMVLVPAALALGGCSQVVESSPTAQQLKIAAAGAWICPGMHAEWIDDRTVQCLKERAE